MALVAVLQACDLPKSACMMANNKIYKTLQFSTEFLVQTTNIIEAQGWVTMPGCFAV